MILYTENSNLAKIKYYKQNGKFYVQNFDNFLTKKEIVEQYGKGVWNEYKSSDHYMIKVYDEEEVVRVLGKEMFYLRKHTNDHDSGYSKRRFQEIIEAVKQAGKNFLDTIKKVDNKKVKTIKI